MYTLGDFLIQIKNAYMAHKKELTLKSSKLSRAIAKILADEGYIKAFSEKEEDGRKIMVVTLLYRKKNPAISDIHIISKPSVHRYVSVSEVKKSMRNFGIEIVSTSQGVMTNKKAFEAGVGGELICRIS